jgi:HEAT repeat protein
MIVREYSAKALAAIGDTRAVEPLIRALQDNEIVRREAANALNYIGDTRAVEPLIALLLNDYDSQVRQAAATALGSIGDTRAVEPLTQALEDADALVRDAARDALNKIKRGSE